MRFLQRITCRATKKCILNYIKFSIVKQRMISQITSHNQSQIFMAWNDERNKWELTCNKQMFEIFRLASLEEVISNNCCLNGFIEVSYNRVLILADGVFRIVWEENHDHFGAEQCLYLVDVFNKKAKHLVTIAPVF